ADDFAPGDVERQRPGSPLFSVVFEEIKNLDHGRTVICSALLAHTMAFLRKFVIYSCWCRVATGRLARRAATFFSTERSAGGKRAGLSARASSRVKAATSRAAGAGDPAGRTVS